MAWNQDKIEKLASNIINAYHKTTDEERKNGLVRDLINLDEILKHRFHKKLNIDWKEYSSSKNPDEQILLKERLDYLNRKNIEYLKPLENFKIRRFMTLPTYVTLLDYENLCQKFFRYYDSYFLEKYCDYMIAGNIWYTSFKPQNGSGCCYPVFSAKTCFIDASFNHTLKYIGAVPHEMAHVMLMEEVDSPKIHIKQFESIIGEAYSNLLELISLDYFSKTNNSMQITANYLEKINGMAASFSCFYASFPSDYNCSYSLYLHHSTRIYSDLLTLHWYDLYLNNPREFFIRIDEYRFNLGIIPDEEILNSYDIQTLVKSAKYILSEASNYRFPQERLYK